ncbi:MAG: hypothetical protein HYZ87_00450 [Candidatus Omnitrophica bacterium]|nr:hypothetical protein [Candidatus Omnitrophota bacterium]
MKRIYALVLTFVSGFILQTGVLFAEEGHSHSPSGAPAASEEATVTKKYVCPMHADVQSDKPGECPKCGMFLKEAAPEEETGASHAGHSHEHA